MVRKRSGVQISSLALKCTLKMKKIIFILLIVIISCDKSEENQLVKQINVSVFLYENCPIAQYMTLPLNEIYDEFSSQNISFTAYFPNILSSPKTISNFQAKYSILFSCIDDHNGDFSIQENKIEYLMIIMVIFLKYSNHLYTLRFLLNMMV